MSNSVTTVVFSFDYRDSWVVLGLPKTLLGPPLGATNQERLACAQPGPGESLIRAWLGADDNQSDATWFRV